jgi:hypothetical protein
MGDLQLDLREARTGWIFAMIGGECSLGKELLRLIDLSRPHLPNNQTPDIISRYHMTNAQTDS